MENRTESHIDYRAIYDANPDAAFILSEKGRILHANLSAVQRYGYALEELLLMNVSELAATQLIDKVSFHLQQSLASGDKFEWRHRRRDGSELSVEIYAKPIIFQGKPVIYSSVRDITERKQMEASLRDSEARFRAYIEQAADALFVHDFSGRFLDVNQQACDSLGYSRNELLQMTVMDVETGFDLASAQTAWREIRPEQHFILQGRQRRKDGTIFPVEVSFGCFDLKGTRHYLGLVRDITERVRIDAALRESEQRFRALFDQAGVGVAQIDTRTGRFVRINQKFCDILGYSREQMEQSDFQTLTHPDDLAVSQSVMEALKAGKIRETTLEKRYLRKDGSLVWVNLTVAAMCAPGEKPDFHVTVAEDITERKRAVDTIRDRETFISGILGSISDSLFTLDKDWRYTFVNDDFVHRTGKCREELLGQCMWELFPEAMGMEVNRIFQRAMTERIPIEYEVYFPPFQKWFASKVYPTSDGGLMVYSKDITERKLAEIQIQRLNRFYLTLSETSQMMVRMTDVTALLQNICDIAVQHAGFCLAWIATPGDDWFKVAASAGKAAGYLDGIRIAVVEGIPEGRGPTARAYHEGLHYICNDFQHDAVASPWKQKAAQFGLKASATFPLRKAGQVIAVFNVYADQPDIFQEAEVRLLDEMAMDISFTLDHLQQQFDLQQAVVFLEQARRDLEERVRSRTVQLEAAMRKAEMADKMKSAFLATMSHELRTPLNSIIGFTGVMLQGLAGPINPEQNKQLNIVKSAGRHLLELVNDVLDISKIEAGEFQITFEMVDLPALLRTMIERLRPLADAQGLALKLDVSEGVASIRSNARRLEQVVGNLLSNALKFTDQGEIRLSCILQGNFVKITVSDTGIGIEQQNIPKLFQPFVQLDVGPERVAKGTGLGLVISRRIVEALGGAIGLESEPGVGSRFYFTLPLTGAFS